MDITYLGHASFRIKGGKKYLVTDPYEGVGFSFPKNIKADLVTISHHHDDHAFVEGVKGEPFVIDAPGEYEVEGIDVIAFSTYHDDEKGKERGKNLVIQFTIEDFQVLHCGDLGHDLSSSIVDELAEIDVMMVPVGGVYSLDPKGAKKIINTIAPKIVIPMHYKTDDHDQETFGEMKTVEEFLESADLEYEKQEELSLSRSDLPEDTKVVVLEQKGS